MANGLKPIRFRRAIISGSGAAILLGAINPHWFWQALGMGVLVGICIGLDDRV